MGKGHNENCWWHKKTFYFFRQTRYLDHGGSSQESMKEYLVSTSLYTPGETSQ